MANVKTKKGVIAILTGGGDVPGLNPAIRAVTIRANREGYQVIGLRRGWAGIMELVRDNKADNSNCYQLLTDDIVNKAGRTGGTFLHTSRTRSRWNRATASTGGDDERRRAPNRDRRGRHEVPDRQAWPARPEVLGGSRPGEVGLRHDADERA